MALDSVVVDNRPALVFVPGSWHKPSCYDLVMTRLRTAGWVCTPVTLPTTTGNPVATFKDDIDAARMAVKEQTTRGRDVVIIAHSYGGMVGNSAIRDLARSKTPAVTARDGHVTGLVLIASGFTITGVSFMAPLMDRPPPFWRVNAQTGFAEIVGDPAAVFYHDVPKDQQDLAIANLTSQSSKALFEGGEHAYGGWMDVPTTYIGTVEDQGLPVLVQRMAVGMARAQGGHVTHYELQTSHSPFLSQPDEVASIIAKAAGGHISAIEKGIVIDTAGNNRIAVPSVKLFAPSTWFRFGLPLGFGYLLGWGFLCFKGVKRLWRTVF
ncbi:hypothetical protein HKX48_000490 [Thoreauomyces humboldtii]|nr:hypothetical protein HKX48_000490 [Thoreauomyces humboldtii]